jgi:hypothetical protein
VVLKLSAILSFYTKKGFKTHPIPRLPPVSRNWQLLYPSGTEQNENCFLIVGIKKKNYFS